jgi:hypothetical protein
MLSRICMVGVIAIVIMGGVRASATTYYVAKTGSDSGACSQSSPCLTITHAYSLASGGDVVQVAPGTYNESVNLNRAGSSGNVITVQGYAMGGSCPKGVLADPLSPIHTRTAPTVKIQSATLSADYNTLDCFYFTADGASIRASNTNLMNNFIDGSTMPTGGTYGTTGVTVDNGTSAGPTNVVASHNYTTSTEYGFLVRASNSTFSYNEVNGLQYGGTTGDCDYNRVFGSSNTFSYGYYHGFNGATQCVAAKPHVDCWQAFSDAGASYGLSQNMKFIGNSCQNFNEGFMLSNDQSIPNFYQTWTIENNVFDLGTMGPWCGVFDSQGFTVNYYHNTCYNGEIVIRDSWDGAGGATFTATNNIFYIPGWYVGSCPYAAGPGGTVSANSAHNVAYDPGYTLKCTGTGNLDNINPLLVSVGSNYQLQSGSPAIGAATNIGINTDHDGNPRPTPGGGYDVGAYQSVSSSSGAVNAPTGLSATVQ